MQLDFDLSGQVDAEREDLVRTRVGLHLELLLGFAVHVQLVGDVTVDAQLDGLAHARVDRIAVG